MQDNLKLVVISPIRNEAWVLDAFLTHTSSWADQIILADQHSTDESREIARKFPKVTLIDNSAAEMNMAATRRLLFEETDRIGGEKIIFALDADEFLSDGFMHTDGWNRIIHSAPDSIFCFRWTNLHGDYRHFEDTPRPYEWACHFSAGTKVAELYRKHESSPIHESRIPCIAEARYIDIDDITFVHLGRLNKQRTANKELLYQIHSIQKGISPVSIYRSYNTPPLVSTAKADIAITTSNGDSLKHLIHTSDNGQHYIDEAISFIRAEGTRKFQWLCIWDNSDLQAAGIRVLPPLRVRLFHKYLQITQKYRNLFFVMAIDRILKQLLP